MGAHFKNDCLLKDKAYFVLGYIGYKSTHCRNKQKNKKIKFKIKVNIALFENIIKDGKKQKYVNTKINGQTVKLLLDTGSDISIINEETCKKIGSPQLKNTEKEALSVSRGRRNFKGEISCNVSFIKNTFKSKVYVLPGTTNLFYNNWIVLFDLNELPFNSFCNKVDVLANGKNKETEKFISDLKKQFPHVFSEGIGECTKTKVRFELKDNINP